MRIIKGILNEELERSQRLLAGYKKSLGNLPKGAPISKKVGDKIFWYLEYRDNGKIVFKYLGKLDPHEVEKLKKAKEERQKLQKMTKEMKKQVAFLQRALRERRQNAL